MILYFSCTGNTRWAAHLMAERLHDVAVDITTLPQGDTTLTLKEGERLGFCFPVHGWRPPRYVRQFIARLHMPQASGHFCFALTTAGDTVGEAMDIFRHDLALRGIKVDSVYSLLMPESYVGLPFMDVDKPENERRKIDTAGNMLEQIVEDIESNKKGVSELTIGRWPKINSRIIGAFFVNHLIGDKPFRVDTKRCIGCGVCRKVCPVGNIRLSTDKQPKWLHNGACLSCFACYHHCPQRAIEYGKRTKGKGQYYFGKNKAEFGKEKASSDRDKGGQ